MVLTPFPSPKCPQIYVDVGHLLRIPPHHRLPREPEDEFNCINLDVVLPKSGLLSNAKRLPVLVWIHGKTWTEMGGKISLADTYGT